MCIVVTGAGGFLGRHVVPVLQQHYGRETVVPLTRSQYDLEDRNQVRSMLRHYRPEVVVHLAAYVGGIGANRRWPADFFFRNTLLTVLMFEEACRQGVRKLVYPMGGCSYPARATSPIGEDQMWDGYPQPDSAPYSVAKKLALVASAAYRQQHGFRSVVLIPGNMYGEYDNFSYEESHVVPALIRRFYEARLQGKPEVVAWGSGAARRDFVYAGDVARVFPFFIDHYDSSQPVNISSGRETTIRELTLLVAESVGYPGRIVWDTSKPEGQKVKIFDTTRMRRLGLSCPTSLEEGIRRTAAWFMENYATGGDGLRLHPSRQAA